MAQSSHALNSKATVTGTQAAGQQCRQFQFSLQMTSTRGNQQSRIRQDRPLRHRGALPASQ
jgi:hypothetical protein